MTNITLTVVPVLLGFVETLEDIFKAIFVSPFQAMFSAVLNAALSLCKELFMAWFGRTLYGAWIAILKFDWILEQIYDIFSGVVGVYVKEGSTWRVTSGHANVIEDQSFLDVLFNRNVIQNAYWQLMIASFVLCFLFTIIAVIRSMGDSIAENKRPVTHVLRMTFKTCITFLLVPMAVLLVIKLSSVTVAVIANTAGSEDMKLCDSLYVAGVGDEFKSSAYKERYSRGRMFQHYSSIEAVNYRNINYFIAYLSSGFCVIVLSACIIQSILRIMVILLLFILSPFFVSTMPLDDGERFRRWVKMFMAFSLACFGPIIAMRIYLAIIPLVGTSDGAITLYKISGSLGGGKSFFNWTGDGLTGLIHDAFKAASNFIMRMVIVMGGAFATWRSQYVIMQIVDPSTVQLMKRGELIMVYAKKGASAAANYITAGAASLAKGAAGAMQGGGSGGEGGGGKFNG
ncbi:MAG: hypothetical protein J6P05_03620 [Lachnospiraceae bacterium]|nr:hypothetical protein [Lachnospiraceae bacterium]